MLIYKMVDKTNGKIYIGQTKRTLKERMAEHKRHNRVLIDKVIKKKGLNNFEVSVIDTAETEEGLNQKERKWIVFFESMFPKGYNLCFGGNTTEGFKHTDDAKKKMSISKIGKYLGKNNPFYGKQHTDEQKKKWSAERKGKVPLVALKASIESRQRKVRNTDTKEVFKSIKEAAEKYNLASTHISRVCRGKRKRTGGFGWEYID